MSLLDRIAADCRFAVGAVRTLARVAPITRHPGRTFPDVIEDLVARHGDRPALESPRETFSYAELGARANRWARWARAQGLAKGEVVALLMPNRPEFLAVWIGITRVGGVVALQNTNLAGKALAHCLEIVRPRHVIVAAELAPLVDGLALHCDPQPRWWIHGPGESRHPRVDRDVDALDGSLLTAAERVPVTIEDHALYIYTSGTTGLPKAANVNHYRIMAISHAFAGGMATRPSDRMYDCLPMYHTVGGVLATGATLIGGGTVVIRERFSRTEFWADVVRERCTLFQYIGELCRYLLSAPEVPAERNHRIRIACGNGLRPDIWEAFKARFQIPHIFEFYAATEGNVALFNFDGTPGSIGRIPWWLEHRLVVKLVEFDVEAEQPIRDARGFCITCRPGEVGEAIGQVVDDPKKPANRFAGYAEKRASEAKVIRDVFEPGDRWFRTGDLMRQDGRGYYYFVDRIGDTFRWKGENVATAQVAEVLNTFPGVTDATVYGVAIPGRDGRAGMAAVLAREPIDMAALARHLDAALPAYARPLFLRLRPELELTSTFKQRKIELVREGFDPDRIADPLYIREGDGFVLFDHERHRRLLAGEIRL